MGTRGNELRRRHNRILFWSLAIAVLVHAAVFFVWPTMTVEVPLAGEVDYGPDGEIRPGAVVVDAIFGPPRIFLPGGGTSLEPPERVLETSRILSLPTGCEILLDPGQTPLRGYVRLQVLASGRTLVAGIDESTGDRCADRVILDLARDLLYRWIPNERFPAPVQLTQPVTLVETDALTISAP